MTTLEQFVQLLINLPINTINFLWSIINPIIKENWMFISIVIIIFLNIAMLKFLLTQRWGTLGSLLYNTFYFGIIYLIINTFGPEIILEDYFKTILILAYVAGFFLTRIILKAINIRNLPKFNH
ncbi:hypothetical protein MB09_01530 [Aequorivita vladivostokensis]|uniref:Uncharacterized protein n=1 Tax=Aequorivita vladivostokensis TaxID=171194 RepID=A0ABR5DM87_9FLAO|nr:hypothetical protein MB09_01530 [Aequorivita vladivostokensis]